MTIEAALADVLLHKCTRCGEEKPWSKFQLYKGKPNGQCRECKTLGMKEKRKRDGIPVKRLSYIEDGKKLCMECGEMKSLDEFSPSKRGLGGVSAYCKKCQANKYRNKEKAVRATRTYRERHKARHLANHRVRMHEYRTHKKVTSDGSVTDAVLNSLYGELICHYCKKETPESERTIDHRVPLSKGGGHIASNLVMACWSCNCSKRDLDEKDFIERNKIDN